MAFLALSLLAATAAVSPELAALAPKFAALLERAASEPEAVADELRAFSASTIMQPLKPAAGYKAANSSLPLVVAHGMGDSCFNRGMESITEKSGEHLGVYSTCIPTGDSRIADTLNGFLMNMDKSVDVFAQKVKADPKLAGGFNAFGLSQVCLCRGARLRCASRPPSAPCAATTSL